MKKSNFFYIVSPTVAAFIILIALGFNIYAKLHNYVDKDIEPATNSYKVVKIVDGDTIILDINGVNTKVRLIGVDTPESVHNDASRNCVYGEVASEYTKGLLKGKSVTIEYDEERTDKYDRTLAYIYLPDGTMLNELLVRNGYAVAKEYKPNVKYTNILIQAQKEAKENKLGMWNDSISVEDTGGLKMAA